MEATERTAPKIESNDLTLSDLFKDFYQVPDFQREYVWEAEHVEKLLTDVLDEFYDEESRIIGESEYFIGSVVACPDQTGTFQLVDGQQRLTTIYLTICAIRDQLIQLEETTTQSLQTLIKAVSMDRQTMEDVSRYRLALQYEDSHGVLEIIADAATPVAKIPQSTESVRHICTAYKTICEFVNTNFEGDNKRIKQFLAAFMHRVKLIRIVTPNLAHALKVFETINDRGVGLNAMDLLKNLLFMKTRPADYPKLKERWKELIDVLDQAQEKPLRFLRYYIMSHHEIDTHRGLREDEIYDWFVANGHKVGIDANPITFVNRLVACAKAYRYFLDGKDRLGAAVPYLRNVSRLAGGAVRQHLILLLAAQELPTPLFTELCRNIENLFFCYLVIREPTKTFERNFARWSADLRSVSDEASLKAFVGNYLLREMSSRAKSVEFALAELTQSRIQQYRMRYIPGKLTQYVDQSAWDNPAHATLEQYVDSAVHIEHVLPQTPTDELKSQFDKPDQYDDYVERLGNLVLLEKTINTSVGNGRFVDKKPCFAHSTFLLTKSLAEKPQVGLDTKLNRAVKDLPQFATWTSQDIEDRQKMLVTLATEVWLRDAVSVSPEDK